MSEQVGQDIRALRKARGLTLAALAEAVGRSVGWLSQVERGQTLPAIPDLARLGETLGVTISFFFRAANRNPAERGLIQRAADRSAIGDAGAGLTEELLSPSLGGSFEMLKSTLAPHAHSQILHPTPPREDGGVVIAGQFILTIGAQDFHLDTGDSFQFAGKSYSWRNPHDAPAVVLWVISPPVY
ncbi:XRE family transcriptional regulator [Cypionkella aquatica]|uniref:XRE family transcriptional regulator n=1 Tax=Cypionkella aquatica TaxID=1756042 RepID=A0AA37TTI9_9RHOB|nr:XRE family transcriptional regulator [Cypionkella aquatica]GLS87208.1 XRE family transcriptional regulator [Cypionkella aquatica]